MKKPVFATSKKAIYVVALEVALFNVILAIAMVSLNPLSRNAHTGDMMAFLTGHYVGGLAETAVSNHRGDSAAVGDEHGDQRDHVDFVRDVSRRGDSGVVAEAQRIRGAVDRGDRGDGVAGVRFVFRA